MKKTLDQQGGVFVIVCISMVALIVFMALAIDVGWVTYAKRQAQTAVDAAAMAGAAAVPACYGNGDEPRAEALATIFNQGTFLNQVMGSSPSISDADGSSDIQYVDFDFKTNTATPAASFDDSNGMQVTKRFTVNHFIKAFTGLYSTDVEATATAVLGGVNCIAPTLPFSLIACESVDPKDSNYVNFCRKEVCGTEIEVPYKTSSDKEDNGAWFVPKLPDGSVASASECKAVVAGEKVMDEICGDGEILLQNGVVSSCLQKIEFMWNEHNVNTESEVYGTPYRVIVPIIDCASFVDFSKNADGKPEAKFNQSAKILGLTQVVVKQVISTGSDKRMILEFECGYIEGTVAGGRCCGITGGAPVLVR